MEARIKSRYGDERLITLISEENNQAVWTIERVEQLTEGFMRCSDTFIDFDGGPFISVGMMLARIISKKNGDDIHIVIGFQLDKELGKYKIYTKILSDKPLIYIEKD
jgi:PDZ domain-containing secreted protein